MDGGTHSTFNTTLYYTILASDGVTTTPLQNYLGSHYTTRREDCFSFHCSDCLLLHQLKLGKLDMLPIVWPRDLSFGSQTA